MPTRMESYTPIPSTFACYLVCLMDWNDALQWLVLAFCILTFIRAIRMPQPPARPIFICVGFFLLMPLLRLLHPDLAGWIAGAIWLVVVIVPGTLVVMANRRGLRYQYADAAIFTRAARWFYPGPKIRQQAKLYEALALAEKGEIDSASHILAEVVHSKTLIGNIAELHLFRVRQQWPQALDWIKKKYTEQTLARQPAILVTALRAMGENGQVEPMLETFARNQHAFDDRIYFAHRSLARLFAFAFAGQIDRTKAAFVGQLSLFPSASQEFWIATAEFAANRPDAARARLAPLDSASSASLRAGIKRRLENPPVPVTLSPGALEFLDRLDLDRQHEDKYAGRSPFGRRPRITYALIAANVAMFAVECLAGGSTNIPTLYRLGAMSPWAVTTGQYWRLFTANFLHFGSAHLVLNMLALLALGAFVEVFLGRIQYLFLYLLSGIIAFAGVWAMQIGDPVRFQIAVGASGAIMGLLGAAIAIFLRGMIRDRAAIARRQLLRMLSIVGLQVVFDFLTPQVSQSAHLFGLAAGFVIACLIPRPSRPTQTPP